MRRKRRMQRQRCRGRHLLPQLTPQALDGPVGKPNTQHTFHERLWPDTEKTVRLSPALYTAKDRKAQIPACLQFANSRVRLACAASQFTGQYDLSLDPIEIRMLSPKCGCPGVRGVKTCATNHPCRTNPPLTLIKMATTTFLPPMIRLATSNQSHFVQPAKPFPVSSQYRGLRRARLPRWQRWSVGA